MGSVTWLDLLGQKWCRRVVPVSFSMARKPANNSRCRFRKLWMRKGSLKQKWFSIGRLVSKSGMLTYSFQKIRPAFSADTLLKNVWLNVFHAIYFTLQHYFMMKCLFIHWSVSKITVYEVSNVISVPTLWDIRKKLCLLFLRCARSKKIFQYIIIYSRMPTKQQQK